MILASLTSIWLSVIHCGVYLGYLVIACNAKPGSLRAPWDSNSALCILFTVTVIVCRQGKSRNIGRCVNLSLATWPLQMTGVSLYPTSDISHLPHCLKRPGFAHYVVLPALVPPFCLQCGNLPRADWRVSVCPLSSLVWRVHRIYSPGPGEQDRVRPHTFWPARSSCSHHQCGREHWSCDDLCLVRHTRALVHSGPPSSPLVKTQNPSFCVICQNLIFYEAWDW